MSESHSHPPKPSPLLALIALAIVHRFRPAWCAIHLADAAGSEGVRAERLSRLCSRAVGAFEQYAVRDRDSGWAKKAQRKKAELAAK